MFSVVPVILFTGGVPVSIKDQDLFPDFPVAYMLFRQCDIWTSLQFSRPKTLTPIELAQRQNQQLMLAYKNRMAKLGTKSNTSSANMVDMHLLIECLQLLRICISKTRKEENE